MSLPTEQEISLGQYKYVIISKSFWFQPLCYKTEKKYWMYIYIKSK